MSAQPQHWMLRNACCAVASNGRCEANIVSFLLKGEFTEILPVTTVQEWDDFVAHGNVSVLLLAFSEVAAGQDFYSRYMRHCVRHGGSPAQAVMLCAREEVSQAYDLCRTHGIFDYVMFWPFTHDPKRLPLAAHRACDAYETESVPRRPPLRR